MHPKRSNTLKGSTHVAFLMKYFKAHNKFENIWRRFE